jgi:hypothetical protein
MEEQAFWETVTRILEEINSRLKRIEGALESKTTPFKRSKEDRTPLDVDVLLSLPDHLRQTAMAVSAKGSATAEEIALDTGRSRAAESDYLNQLVKMGHLSKKRKGRIVCFHA